MCLFFQRNQFPDFPDEVRYEKISFIFLFQKFLFYIKIENSFIENKNGGFKMKNQKPLTLMGRRAGVCWGADITDDEKNRYEVLEEVKIKLSILISKLLYSLKKL